MQADERHALDAKRAAKENAMRKQAAELGKSAAEITKEVGKRVWVLEEVRGGLVVTLKPPLRHFSVFFAGLLVIKKPRQLALFFFNLKRKNNEHALISQCIHVSN